MAKSDKKEQFVYLTSVEQLPYDVIAKKLNVSRRELSQWWEQTRSEREKIRTVRTLYNRKKNLGLKKITFKKFYDWYIKQSQKCHYCHISQNEIDELFRRKLVRTSRKVTRGRRLELERIRPKIDYSRLTNLTLACYWCNNAKSDEFDDEEFKKIGLSIGKALKARLK